MQISDVKLFIINKGGKVEFGLGNTANYVLLTVHTDRGITGVGEAFHSLDEPIEGCVRKFRRWLIGEDPTRVLHHWQAIYRGLRYPLGTAELAALSAVEQALWDIAGKDCGLPIYKMLGGPSRDRVRGYASGGCWPAGNYGTFHERVQAVVDAGWPALKFSPQDEEYTYDPPRPTWHHGGQRSSHGELAAMVDRVRRVRESVGDDIEICLDYHGRSFSPAEAIRLAREIEPYHPFFLEEPALTENPDSLVQIKGQTAIPIAGGERVVHRDLFKSVIEKRAVDILQLEPTACGGILETVKRAAVAELYHVVLAPHHAGSPVALCACAHIDMSVPNFLIQEVNTDVGSPLNRDLFSGMPSVTGGWIEMTGAPGIGLEFNEEAAGDHPPKAWDRPVVIEADGSIGLE